MADYQARRCEPIARFYRSQAPHHYGWISATCDILPLASTNDPKNRAYKLRGLVSVGGALPALPWLMSLQREAPQSVFLITGAIAT